MSLRELPSICNAAKRLPVSLASKLLDPTCAAFLHHSYAYNKDRFNTFEQARDTISGG
jgi:hypothetical protein